MAINLMAPKGDKKTVKLAERVLAKLRKQKPNTVKVERARAEKKK